MRSMSVVFAATILVIVSPAIACADEASKNAKIGEMMQLTRADQMLTQVLNQMKATTASQFEKMDIPADARARMQERQQKMMAMIADRLSWEKTKPAFIKVYSDTFSESELDSILVFYKSPAGRAMLDKMPELMQKSMAVGQQLMGDIMPEIQRMTQEMKEQDNKPAPK